MQVLAQYLLLRQYTDQRAPDSAPTDISAALRHLYEWQQAKGIYEQSIFWHSVCNLRGAGGNSHGATVGNCRIETGALADRQ